MNGAILHSGCREERPSQAKTLVKKKKSIKSQKKELRPATARTLQFETQLAEIKAKFVQGEERLKELREISREKKNRFLQTRYPKNRQTDTISDDEDDFEMLFKSERTDLSTADDDDERVKQGSKKYRNLYRQSCSFYVLPVQSINERTNISGHHHAQFLGVNSSSCAFLRSNE